MELRNKQRMEEAGKAAAVGREDTGGKNTAIPAFSLSGFAPAWGAVVMGTGVISVVFYSMSAAGMLMAFSAAVSIVFFWVVVLVGVAILGVTAARWLTAPKRIIEDLHHPVKGGMMATFPGGILVLAVVFGRAGQLVLGTKAAFAVTSVLTVIGGTLALVVGFVFITRFLSRGNVKNPMITGAWFIPPVVTVLVPPALAPMMNESTGGERELLWLSWVLLGVGTFLFIMVATVLFYRSITTPPPPAKLAPTLVIGGGPAGLIALDILVLSQATVRVGAAPEAIVALSLPASMMFWGFGLWWLVAAAIMLVRSYQRLPFGLSWWAFLFPLGAWIVAGVNLTGATNSRVVGVVALVAVPILLILWIAATAGTVRRLLNKSIWVD